MFPIWKLILHRLFYQVKDMKWVISEAKVSKNAKLSSVAVKYQGKTEDSDYNIFKFKIELKSSRSNNQKSFIQDQVRFWFKNTINQTKPWINTADWKRIYLCTSQQIQKSMFKNQTNKPWIELQHHLINMYDFILDMLQANKLFMGLWNDSTSQTVMIFRSYIPNFQHKFFTTVIR